MIEYTVAYRMEMGAFLAWVPGFPEVSALGPTLAEARENVRAALRLAAEGRLRNGEALPLPGPPAGAPDAYTMERVRLGPGEGRVVVSW
jgi:predicted RNase H-like HicB family nuclease